MLHCYRASRRQLVVAGGAIGALVPGLCGLSVTLFAMIVAMIPPPGTSDILLHEVKLMGGSIFLVLIGLSTYRHAKRKQLSTNKESSDIVQA